MASTQKQRSIKDCRVLIIDDNPSIRLLLEEFLSRMGIKHIEHAENGKEGLEKADAFMPDLILLDYHMPSMNGLEALQHFRSNIMFKDIPIIIETVDDSYSARSSMFEAGATDFVSSPIVPKEFYSRIRLHLENRLLIHELETQLLLVETELNNARQMQIETLPSAKELLDIKSKYGISIKYLFEPSFAIGGDFWGVIPINDDSVAVYACDFSGHGVTAALNTFRLHTLLKGLSKIHPDNPAAYFCEINDHLSGLLNNGQFATFILGVINTSKDTFTYSAAGTPSPVIGIGGTDIKFIDGSGLPLGITKEVKYENRVEKFPKGSFLFMYSDALNETTCKNGSFLKQEDIFSLVQNATLEKSSEHPLDYIMNNFSQQISEPISDDLTAIWLSRS